MEPKPHNPFGPEQTSSDDKKESKKNKKKKAENLGSFIIESKPAGDKSPAENKPASVWENLTGRAKKEKVTEQSEAQAEKKEPHENRSEPASQGAEKQRRDKPAIESRHHTFDEDIEDEQASEMFAEEVPEVLDESEKKMAFQSLAAARLEELSAELQEAQEDSAEEQATRSAIEYVRNVAETGDPDAALDETATRLGLEKDLLNAAIPGGQEAGDDAEVADLVEPAEADYDDEPLLLPEDEVLLRPTPSEADPDLTVLRSAASSAPGSAQSSSSGSASSNGTNTILFGSSPSWNIPTSSAAMHAQQIMNAAPLAPMTPLPQSQRQRYYNSYHTSHQGEAVASVVSYLAGRRAGKVRAEKKLLPLQKKLRKEVAALENKISTQEYEIRKVVQAGVKSEKTPVSRPIAHSEKRTALQPRSAEKNQAVHYVVQKAETRRMSASFVPAEKIGHVVVLAEALPYQQKPRTEITKPGTPSTPETVPATKKMSPEKEAMSMNRIELLKLSEKIIIDGASLRQIYETHLVGERGLRRLISLYLQGRDIKRALRLELVEREIDFERDPQLRDRARSSMSGGGKSSVRTLLAEAGTPEVVIASVNTHPSSPQPTGASPALSSSRHMASHHAADTSLIVVIAILLAIIIYVAATRS